MISYFLQTLIMTKEIQSSFQEILNLTNWIDEDTKALASEKVDEMMLRIGYPDYILDTEQLTNRYRDVSCLELVTFRSGVKNQKSLGMIIYVF